MAISGEHAEGCGLTADEIPCGHHMIDRLARTDRSGRRRISHRTIHRVVEGGRTVSVAGDSEHHQIRPLRRQRLEGHPAAGRKVGEEVACVSNEAREQFLRPITTEVDSDRTLPLVETGPIDRFAGVGQRPTAIVDPTTNLIETNDISTELSEGHAPRWGGDEGRPLDHTETIERGCLHRLILSHCAIAVQDPATATSSRCGGRVTAAGAVNRSS